jgi:hypothetical protein
VLVILESIKGKIECNLVPHHKELLLACLE